MKPIIAITMGDAAGVGPEIIAKAMADQPTRSLATMFVIGDLRRLQLALDVVSSTLTVNRISDPSEVTEDPTTIDVLDIPCIPEDLAWGELSAEAGHGAFLFIEKAVELAMAGKIDAICTGPLNKAALHMGGHKFPGHTEMLAQLAGVEEVSMMLTAPNMRVIHVTTHLGLVDAIAAIDGDRVYRTITRGNDLLVRSGNAHPRIAVAAINPHGGENGLFGNDEEAQKIQPGVDRARAEGLDVIGPLPADTLFMLASRGDYDLVVAQYHDQGHIPVKVLGLKNGVNVTVGLPFVRTSVDHGTAFDIAGKDIVDHEPLLEALRQAADLSPERAKAEMNARDRRREIGHRLQEKPVNVDELAAVFAVSASTIRRDLDTMARNGDIVRTYGGAQTVGGPERSLRERESIAVEQKAAIGRLASTFVPDGAVAVLDAGTTVGALARNLVYREGLTVVTTGLTTTNVLEQSTGVDLIVVGGRLRHISSGFVGPFAERVMADVSADVAFLGADGVSAEHGLCEETPEQASLKRVMVERARELYVLADSSKLGVASAHWWTRIERPWVLVTDDGATEEQLAPFRTSESVTVHVATGDAVGITARRASGRSGGGPG